MVEVSVFTATGAGGTVGIGVGVGDGVGVAVGVGVFVGVGVLVAVGAAVGPTPPVGVPVESGWFISGVGVAASEIAGAWDGVLGFVTGPGSTQAHMQQAVAKNINIRSPFLFCNMYIPQFYNV